MVLMTTESARAGPAAVFLFFSSLLRIFYINEVDRSTFYYIFCGPNISLFEVPAVRSIRAAATFEFKFSSFSTRYSMYMLEIEI